MQESPPKPTTFSLFPFSLFPGKQKLPGMLSLCWEHALAEDG